MKKILLLVVFITIQLHSQTKTAKMDYKQFNENRRIKFEKFKIDNQGIEQYYNKVNKKILDNVLKDIYKRNLRNKECYIYIKYLNNRAYFDQNSCFDGIDQEYNFLITKFWNKSVLEYAQKKYNKEIPIEVQFSTPYKIEVNETKNITTYEYKNNKWKISKD